jgi:16S rRNA (cytosine1402-N4)-methyltransferase
VYDGALGGVGELEHVPVLLDEVLGLLAGPDVRTVLDATLGGGGHAEALLARAPGIGLLVGLDRDEEAVQRAARRLDRFGDRVKAVKSHFADMGEVLDAMGLRKVDAVLMDLGMSSFQLADGERGFSFQKDGPLDMRMDKSFHMTASDVVNGYSEQKLTSIFREYGEEPAAKRIARAIVRERAVEPITSTVQLAGIVESAAPRRGKPGIHPATRVFQAIRIAVNGELARLHEAVETAVDRLNPGGRLAVISFHSLEDRIVKNAFLDMAGRCVCPPGFPVCACGRRERVKILTRKPVQPGENEVAQNPRARSAKLRAVEKTGSAS